MAGEERLGGTDRLIMTLNDAPVGAERRHAAISVSRIPWISTLAMIAVVTTLYVGRSFFIPLTIGVLFALSLMPIVRLGQRIGIRAEFCAVMILAILIGAVGFGITRLSDPIREWVTTLPASANIIEDRLRYFVVPVQEMTETARQLEKVTGTVSDPRSTIALRPPSLIEQMLLAGRDVVLSLGLVLLFLYFFLAYGERFIANARIVFPVAKDGTDAGDVMNDIGRSMSQYLLLVGAINCLLGLAEFTAMYALGMPNAALWGAMAAALNFIPYVGGMVGLGVVSAVSLLTFDTLSAVILPPLVYFIIDSVEGTVVTPLIVGHRFSLNPAMGVVWLVFWGWLWGPLGAFIAMPMLMAFKILCDHLPELAPIGALIELKRGKSQNRLSPLVTE
ncbi:MAG: AI-2E family transporter [Deltaproteobacteria bacterium]|nr:AI-2E family transporter [Deltaproteobacteria bacterium]